MFVKSLDFKKHIKCIEAFDKNLEMQPSETIEVLDLIFKWCNLRISDSSNTQLMTSVLDFYSNLLNIIKETGYELMEFEAQILLGTLCEKSGMNNKVL